MTFIKHFVVAATILLATQFALGQCAPEKHIDVPNIINLTYHDARKLLLENGWQPVSNFRRMEDDLYGNERTFIQHGYYEVESCAGTGVSPCIFRFNDIYGNFLRVATAGEEDENGKYFAGVTNVYFICD